MEPLAASNQSITPIALSSRFWRDAPEGEWFTNPEGVDFPEAEEPFTNEPHHYEHHVVNLGDGTWLHSKLTRYYPNLTQPDKMQAKRRILHFKRTTSKVPAAGVEIPLYRQGNEHVPSLMARIARSAVSKYKPVLMQVYTPLMHRNYLEPREVSNPIQRNNPTPEELEEHNAYNPEKEHERSSELEASKRHHKDLMQSFLDYQHPDYTPFHDQFGHYLLHDSRTVPLKVQREWKPITPEEVSKVEEE